MGHTKGTWAVWREQVESDDPDSDSMWWEVISNESKRWVAKTQSKEDALLCAAAPTLFIACKKALLALESMTTDDYSKGKDRPVRERLSAALNLAEGKE